MRFVKMFAENNLFTFVRDSMRMHGAGRENGLAYQNLIKEGY